MAIPVRGIGRGTARILEQRTIARGYREIRFTSVDSTNPEPGQFLTVLPHRHPVPLLRRPFAYSAWSRGEAAFIYEIRGPMTGDLAELPVGADLDWLGPLGRGFPDPPEGTRPVLISGGIGVGPLYFLATTLAARNLAPLLVLGARETGLVPELPQIPGGEIRIATDDGSAGFRGNAPAAVGRDELAGAALYACGPYPMMREVHRIAVEHQRPCWVSLEEWMACGVGACQGCAVPVNDHREFVRACLEGPVLESRAVAWT